MAKKRMTAKQKVLAKYPSARAWLCGGRNWHVFDGYSWMEILNDSSAMFFAPQQAWADAARRLKERTNDE